MATLIVLPLAVTGCDSEDGVDLVCDRLAEDAPLDRRVETRGIPNGVSFDAVSFNGVSFNGISFNAVSFNGADDAHNHPVLALAATPEGQDLLGYIVRCALDSNQSLTLPTPEGSLELDGALGFAPEWVDRGLTPSESRGVSSCLLAHVNAYGASVPISLRSPDIVSADAVEQDAFSVHEGAFFGDLATGAFYACHAEEPANARGQSADRTWRVCTDETDDCGITSVGACAEVCARYDEIDGWSDCEADGIRYAEVSNTYLRNDNTLAACSEG